MKTLSFVWIGLLCTISVMAQDIPANQVPAAVTAALQKKFPAVTDVKWKLKDNVYRAEFKIEKHGHDLWLDKDGNIKKFKQDIPKASLPAVIKSKIDTDFKGFTLDDVDKIEQDGKTFYQVKLKGTSGERKVLFAADGSVAKDKIE